MPAGLAGFTSLWLAGGPMAKAAKNFMAKLRLEKQPLFY